MTRKHFEALAEWCKEEHIESHKLWTLCEVLKQFNRNFDKEKFMEKADGTV